MNSAITKVNPTPIQSRTIRYICTDTGTYTFYDTDLFKMICCTVDGGTGSHSIMTSLKLRFIKLTVIGDGSGVSEVVFEWGQDRGPDKKTAFLAGPTEPESTIIRPLPGSFTAMWFDLDVLTGSDTMFVVDTTNLAGELLMDIHFDYVMTFDGYALTGPTALSGTDGIFYPKLPAAQLAFVAAGGVSFQ
jgi:hypothetical protein